MADRLFAPPTSKHRLYAGFGGVILFSGALLMSIPAELAGGLILGLFGSGMLARLAIPQIFGGRSDIDNTLEQLAQGDTDVSIDGEDETSDALRTIRDQLEEAQAAPSEEVYQRYTSELRQTAEGNFTRRMDPGLTDGELSALATEFNSMMDEVEETTALLKSFSEDVVTESATVAESTQEVKEASDQVSNAIQEISEGASEQSDHLASVASEMENLSASIEEVAASSKDVAELASRTADTGRKGSEAAEEAIEGLEEVRHVSEDAVDEMNQLAEEINRLVDQVGFISDVAEQTNMLAINAGIEASRAGEAGEGFGVVADRVKELADETQDAAEEIEDSLSRLQEQTTDTVEKVEQTQERIDENRHSVEETVESLDEIADLAQETNDGVQEISDSTDKQASATQEVVDMVDRAATISEETTTKAQQVAAAAEEQTASISQVLQSTSELHQRASWLRDSLDMFRIREDAAYESNLDGAVVTDTAPDRGYATVDTSDSTAGADTETVDVDPDEFTEDAPTASSDATFEGDLETRFGTGIAQGDDGYTAGREAAKKAKRELGIDRVDFVQVFASPKYDYDEMLRGIRSVVGEETKLIGCSSAGEFTEESSQHESVAVAAVTSDTIKFFTGLGTGLSDNVSAAIDDAIANFPEDLDEYPYLSAINLHDGLTGKGERIALVTQRKLGQRVNFAGGSAGDDLALEETYVFEGDRVESDAVALVLIASKNEPPIITANHGHTPLSDETYTVTKADGTTVHELDGRPAFEVWKDAVRDSVQEKYGVDIDEIDPEDDQFGELLTEYEIGVEERRGGETEYRIRWPGLTDSTEGPMEFVVGIPEGTEVRIMHSPPEDQIESAIEAARQTTARKDSSEAAGAFVYDCVCRSALLGDDFGEAVEGMAKELQIPMSGFETYGELCIERGQSSGFHNTTSVIMALPK